MKKFIACLLTLVLLVSTGVAMAGKGENASVFAINVGLEYLKDDENAKLLFNFDESFAYVDDEGDVIVVLESNLPAGIMSIDNDALITFICDMWTGFYKAHSEFSDAPLYVIIHDDDDLIAMTDGSDVVDAEFNRIPFKTGGMAS